MLITAYVGLLTTDAAVCTCVMGADHMDGVTSLYVGLASQAKCLGVGEQQNQQTAAWQEHNMKKCW